jgi:hypothetical protein
MVKGPLGVAEVKGQKSKVNVQLPKSLCDADAYFWHYW